MRRIAIALLFAVGVLSASAKDWKVEPETALEEVNTWDVKPGDRVLFRRGGVWRGTLRVKSGASGSPVTYACFGEGEKPQLSQSVSASDPKLWKSANHDRRFGLWKTVPELAPLLDAEVGCLMADIGKVQDGMTQENIWRKVDAETNVVDQMTFYYDPEERSIVAKRWKDPATWMGNVELLLAKDIVDASGCHDVVFEGLSFRWTAAAAFRCTDVFGVVIRNCDISYVGDGIVFSGVVRGCEVSRCRVWQTLGAAVAADGEEKGAAGEGVAVRDCVTWKCEHTLRVGATKGQATALPVLFEHNTSVDCGIGNLARYQAQPRGRTAHLLVLGGLQRPDALTVRSNVFARTSGAFLTLCVDRSFALDGNLCWFPKDSGLSNRIALMRCKGRGADGRFPEYAASKKEFDRFRADLGFANAGEFGDPDFVYAHRKDYRLRTRGETFGARGMPGVDEDQCVSSGRPYDMEYLRSRLWAAEADGRGEFVMEAWAKYNSKLDPGGPYAFVNVEAGGPVRLRIRALDGRDLRVATIRPARAPAKVVSRNGAEMTIEVAGPCKFAVETDDVTKRGALMVFVNRPVAPPEDGPKVKRFGPGIHRVPGGLVRLGDGETLYLEKGAVLQSAVSARGRDIRICGLGVIDVSHYPHTWGSEGRQYSLVHLAHCRDVTMEDVTIRGSYHWTIYPEASDGVTIRNVKICGDRCNNDDGIDVSNARDVLIDDCFIRTQDDCLAVKGINTRNGPCERLAVTNCVLWADFARIVAVGHESNASHMSDLLFADCDVLHFTRPVFIVQPCDGMAISNVVFRDVRVHLDGRTGAEHVFNFQPISGFSKEKKFGSVSDIEVFDVAFEGQRRKLTANIKGQASNPVRNISVRRVTMNGEPLAKEGFTVGPHAENVIVEP